MLRRGRVFSAWGDKTMQRMTLYWTSIQWCKFLGQELHETSQTERGKLCGEPNIKVCFSHTSCPRNLHFWVHEPTNLKEYIHI